MFMRSPTPLSLLGAVLLLSVAKLAPGGAQTVPNVDPAAVDSIFRTVSGTSNPGCAVGVSLEGATILTRAYGMADLEHGVINTPETIFEPGSVAKQFTAAATILLALDGKLSLDDDIRKYFPELPDYGDVVTVRHLLNHTSGLRDWGSIAAIEGWPRTERAHTHAYVMDILGRQHALNYTPGEFYSYTNSGYNLQAILVERVSGMSFSQFTRERIFLPLGMTHTQWRDDFTRIVEDRAIAYGRNRDGGWFTLMPFESVYGNGGLMTTVEDLLRFTWNLETGEVGGPRFLEEMHRQGILTSGETISYAGGLRIGTYKGVREVQHSGSTAGYTGHLSRFPDQGLGFAVMCNSSGANPGRFLHQVAELYLGEVLDATPPPPPEGAIQLPAQRLQALAGGYRATRTGSLVQITVADGGLRVGGDVLLPVSDTRFVAPGGATRLEFEAGTFADGRPAAMADSPGLPGVRLEPVPSFEPGTAELTAYTGAYRSEEAEVTYTVLLADGELAMKSRWGEPMRMRPLYPDAFSAGGTIVIFYRDASGRVTEMRWSQGRVWDLRFQRLPG